MDNYVKRPSDVIDVQFDLSEFVTEQQANGVAPEDISYTMRSDPGVTIASSLQVTGLIALTVSGGDIGRVYSIGIEARAPDGDSAVDVKRVRVRDPSLFEILPGGTALGDQFIVDPVGDFLVDPVGDFIVSP
jgi:hypothetical protein